MNAGCDMAWSKVREQLRFCLTLSMILSGLTCLPVEFAQADESFTAPTFIQQRYLKAANAGDTKAQFALGLLYERGLIKSETSKQEMIRWYKMSADGGYAAAQFRLGVHYQSGSEADREQAISYYREAAEAGLLEAQFNLALILDQRDEVSEAASWLTRAANQKYPQAMRQLGLFYLEGRGVPQDVVEAWIWMVRAVSAGDNDAVLLVSEIDPLLSDEQRAAAKARLSSEKN